MGSILRIKSNCVIIGISPSGATMLNNKIEFYQQKMGFFLLNGKSFLSPTCKCNKREVLRKKPLEYCRLRDGMTTGLLRLMLCSKA